MNVVTVAVSKVSRRPHTLRRKEVKDVNDTQFRLAMVVIGATGIILTIVKLLTGS